MPSRKYAFGAYVDNECPSNLCTQAVWSGPKVIKLFSCSSQLSMKFVLLISLESLTANFYLLNIAEHDNFSANKYENANFY